MFISHQITKSIDSHIPKIWKCSKVTALFKSGDQTNASNYRLISILPSLKSKILERAVHFQLYDYLNTINLLTDKQVGFRPKHLTVTALASFADDVLSKMERGNLCEAVFLDLSRFDTVDNSILLVKLSSLGLLMLFSGFNPTSVIGSSASHTVKTSPILYLLPMVYHKGASWGPYFSLFT